MANWELDFSRETQESRGWNTRNSCRSWAIPTTPIPVPPDSGNSRVQHENCRGLTGTWYSMSKLGTTGCWGTAVPPAVGWNHPLELGISGSSSSSLQRWAWHAYWSSQGQGQTFVCHSGPVKWTVRNTYGEVGKHHIWHISQHAHWPYQ